MIKNSVRFFLASVAAGSIVTVAAPAMAYDHLTWANFFIGPPAPTTNEIVGGCTINWTTMENSTTAGAGFFIAVLSKAQNWAATDVHAHWGFFCPSSPTLYAAIGSGTYFTHITKAIDIQAEDVIVINGVPGYSGHTMIVESAPVLITHQIAPIYANTQQWRVAIVDSTTTAHGCTDSRWTGTCSPLTGTMDPGAGRGAVRLYTDTATGNLLGYTWSVTASNTSYYSPGTRPYRVGRLTGLMGPKPMTD